MRNEYTDNCRHAVQGSTSFRFCRHGLRMEDVHEHSRDPITQGYFHWKVFDKMTTISSVHAIIMTFESLCTVFSFKNSEMICSIDKTVLLCEIKYISNGKLGDIFILGFFFFVFFKVRENLKHIFLITSETHVLHSLPFLLIGAKQITITDQLKCTLCS